MSFLVFILVILWDFIIDLIGLFFWGERFSVFLEIFMLIEELVLCGLGFLGVCGGFLECLFILFMYFRLGNLFLCFKCLVFFLALIFKKFVLNIIFCVFDFFIIFGWNVLLVISLLRFILIWFNLWYLLDVVVGLIFFLIRINRFLIFKLYLGKLKFFLLRILNFFFVEWFKIFLFCKRLLKFLFFCLK